MLFRNQLKTKPTPSQNLPKAVQGKTCRLKSPLLRSSFCNKPSKNNYFCSSPSNPFKSKTSLSLGTWDPCNNKKKLSNSNWNLYRNRIKSCCKRSNFTKTSINRLLPSWNPYNKRTNHYLRHCKKNKTCWKNSLQSTTLSMPKSLTFRKTATKNSNNSMNKPTPWSLKTQKTNNWSTSSKKNLSPEKSKWTSSKSFWETKKNSERLKTKKAADWWGDNLPVNPKYQ